jgi:hypothetical protein
MLRLCVYMHSRFIENHPIQILEDGLLISEVVLSHNLILMMRLLEQVMISMETLLDLDSLSIEEAVGHLQVVE